MVRDAINFIAMFKLTIWHHTPYKKNVPVAAIPKIIKLNSAQI
jgi:hypothetical protein